jgi:hypothetical protein
MLVTVKVCSHGRTVRIPTGHANSETARSYHIRRIRPAAHSRAVDELLALAAQ